MIIISPHPSPIVEEPSRLSLSSECLPGFCNIDESTQCNNCGGKSNDLFVRWKPIHEQPFGWEPDINDGIRLNTRPFMATDLTGVPKGAGVFRVKPRLKWTKDRGKEPKRPIDEFPWLWNWDEKMLDFTGDSPLHGATLERLPLHQ